MYMNRNWKLWLLLPSYSYYFHGPPQSPPQPFFGVSRNACVTSQKTAAEETTVPPTIDQVRYINILTCKAVFQYWLFGYKENTTKTEICPETLGAMLQYWYIKSVLRIIIFHTYIHWLILFYTFSGRVSRIAITHVTLQSSDREGLGTVEQNRTSTDTWLVLSTLPPHYFITTGILERSPFSLKEFEHVAKYWARTICRES